MTSARLLKTPWLLRRDVVWIGRACPMCDKHLTRKGKTQELLPGWFRNSCFELGPHKQLRQVTPNTHTPGTYPETDPSCFSLDLRREAWNKPRNWPAKHLLGHTSRFGNGIPRHVKYVYCTTLHNFTCDCHIKNWWSVPHSTYPYMQARSRNSLFFRGVALVDSHGLCVALIDSQTRGTVQIGCNRYLQTKKGYARQSG